jgi:hypothetical protein
MEVCVWGEYDGKTTYSKSYFARLYSNTHNGILEKGPFNSKEEAEEAGEKLKKNFSSE